ncbi:glycosyl hydrolase 53 family protein [Streptomyces sp. NPDC052012]|uniref:glycosyl hydrolase 53 family protein n=1 Tax=Streptomyces sp. NPDC052012 TaxID=3155051 RepID=UPI00344C4280
MHIHKRGATATAVGLLLTATTLATAPQSTAASESNLLVNPGFESGLTGWTNIGTPNSAYAQTASPHSGTTGLGHGRKGQWSVNTVQTLTGLTRGTYTLSAWIKNNGVTSAGLQAYSCGDTTQSLDLPQSSQWTRVTLSVSVLSSSCTVGIWSNSGEGTLQADDFAFTRITPGSGGAMAVGGDITYRRMNAAAGGQYADSAGRQKDVLDILAPQGFDLARIRVYNKPGAVVNNNGQQQQLQPGWQDIDDAVKNAQDAKARGMKILLSFHYSDFWTNPALQIRPEDWAGYSQGQLETAVYDYTAASVRAMKDAGVTPEYVSLGNEINNALADVSRWTSPADYFALLKSASKAVRDTSPTSRTVIHLTTPDRTAYADWIAGARANGLDYDIMGVSLYPFWTNMSIASLANFASWVGSASGKPVMAMETGYPSTLEASGASETTLIAQNNLDPDGPENYGATPDGQLRWTREFFRAMYDTGKVVGISYWDPIAIDFADGADPNGWIVGGDNEVEDTSFFDYNRTHRALPGLSAFRTW